MLENFSECPLCLTANASLFCYGIHPPRPYHQCSHCQLVFVPNQFHLTKNEEKKIYDQHDNDPSDERYRAFLSKLANPIMDRLKPGDQGLDFGCGPGPTLYLILKDAGFSCTNYDPIYEDNKNTLESKYDYIVSTEVFEHLQNPSNTIHQIFAMLNPGGTLGVMTKLIPERTNFLDWHYIKDPTHITFYNEASMQYIADKYRAKLTVLGPDVIIFEANLSSI